MSVKVKISYNDIIKILPKTPSTFDEFSQMAKIAFEDLTGEEKLFYIDSDGEKIEVENNEDYEAALKYALKDN